MTFCLVALGGNVGPVAETFDRAVDQIDRERELAVASVSSYHRSAPVGANAGGEFLNAAVAIHAECGPMEMLDTLGRIEEANGRKRGQRWSPRTLDLDIITFGEEIIDEPRLRVPHPGCWYRRFVLDPLTEIAASVVHPEKLITFGALRERLLARPFCVELALNDVAARRRLLDDLRQAYPDVEFAVYGEDQPRPRQEPALLFHFGCGGMNTDDARCLPLPLVEAGTVEPTYRFEFARDIIDAALG